MIALKWSDIDFIKKSVSVTKATIRTKAGLVTKSPKNITSSRLVSLPASVMAILRAYKIEQQELRLSLGTAWHGEDFIFIQSDGRQMDISTPNLTFKKIIRRYNENAKDSLLPDITVHGLRHTNATLAIAQNINIRSVSARLGHAETSTTLNIYAHALKEMDEQIADVLETILTVKKA